jgi:hypothetical protein
MAESCDPLLLPLIRRYFELMPTVSGVEQAATGVTHGSAERLSLQKAYFSLIHHLVNHGVTCVLVSATNGSSLNNILSSIIEGCADIPDVLVHKTCFSILRNLVLQWGGVDAAIAAAGIGAAAGAAGAGAGGAGVGAGAGSGVGVGGAGEAVNPQIRAAFRQFVFEQVVPVMFKCPLQPHFDIEDAGASLVRLER